eukprot:7092674-Prymnesium_polylepis.1
MSAASVYVARVSERAAEAGADRWHESSEMRFETRRGFVCVVALRRWPPNLSRSLLPGFSR